MYQQYTTMQYVFSHFFGLASSRRRNITCPTIWLHVKLLYKYLDENCLHSFYQLCILLVCNMGSMNSITDFPNPCFQRMFCNVMKKILTIIEQVSPYMLQIGSKVCYVIENHFESISIQELIHSKRLEINQKFSSLAVEIDEIIPLSLQRPLQALIQLATKRI